QTAAAFRAAILAEYAEPLNSTLSDATIVSAPKRPVVAPDAGTPSQPKSTPASIGTSVAGGTSTPPPTGWSATVLAGVEVELARFLGPVARVLVRRAAREHKSIDALVAAVVETMERPEDRDAFVRAVTGTSLSSLRLRVPTGPETPVPVSSGSTTTAPMTAEELERATKLLTTYIGPIARVVA